MLSHYQQLTEPILAIEARPAEKQRPVRRPDACAALVYRFCEGELEILMVTAPGTEEWVLPDSSAAAGEASWEAAARAAHVQGGVTGTVFPARIGLCRTSSAVQRRVAVFAFRARSTVNSPEPGLRPRIWMTARVAAARARDREVSSIILAIAAKLQALAWPTRQTQGEISRAEPTARTYPRSVPGGDDSPERSDRGENSQPVPLEHLAL